MELNNSLNNVLDEDEKECRVCRCGSSDDRPLFFPCACKGSIKYVHQDCLLQWLNIGGGAGTGTAQRSNCELCNQEFTFKPIYKPGAPRCLGPAQLFSGIAMKVKRFTPKILRILLVMGTWGSALPLFSLYCAKVFISRSSLEARATFRQLFTYHHRPKDIPGDILLGMIICVFIICITSAVTHLCRESYIYLNQLLRTQREMHEQEANRHNVEQRTDPPVLPSHNVDQTQNHATLRNRRGILRNRNEANHEDRCPNIDHPTNPHHQSNNLEYARCDEDCTCVESSNLNGTAFPEYQNEIAINQTDSAVPLFGSEAEDFYESYAPLGKFCHDGGSSPKSQHFSDEDSDNSDFARTPLFERIFSRQIEDTNPKLIRKSDSFSSVDESDERENSVEVVDFLHDIDDDFEGFDDGFDNFHEEMARDEAELNRLREMQDEVRERLRNAEAELENRAGGEGGHLGVALADDDNVVNLAELMGLEGPVGPAVDAAIQTVFYNIAFLAIFELLPFWVGMFVCAKIFGNWEGQQIPEMPISMYELLKAMASTPWSLHEGPVFGGIKEASASYPKSYTVKQLISYVSGLEKSRILIPENVLLASQNILQDLAPANETLQFWADLLTLQIGWLILIIAAIPPIICAIIYIIHRYGGGVMYNIKKASSYVIGALFCTAEEEVNTDIWQSLYFMKQRVFEFGATVGRNIKVYAVIISEVSLLPWFLGWLIDVFTLRLFSTTLPDRLSKADESHLMSFIIHFVCGFSFMVGFRLVMRELKKIVKEEYLEDIFPLPRQHNLVDNENIALLSDLPIMVSIKRIVMYSLQYTCLIILAVYLPVRVPSFLFKSYSGLKLTFATGFMLEVQLPMELLVFHVVLPVAIEKGHLRQGILSILKGWLCYICSRLDLEFIIDADVLDEYKGTDSRNQPSLTQNNTDSEPSDENYPDQLRNAETCDIFDERNMLNSKVALPVRIWKKFACYAYTCLTIQYPLVARVAAFVMINMFALIATCTFLVHIPIHIGRALFFLSGFPVENDVYSIIIGLIFSWVVIALISFVAKHLIITRTRGEALFRIVSAWVIVMLKWSVIALIWLGLIPALIGVYFEALVTFPLRSQPGNTPKVNMFQDWAMGLVFLKIWVRCILLVGGGGPNAVAYPEEGPPGLLGHKRWARRFERVKARGLKNVELRWTLTHVCFNLLNEIGYFYFVPYFLTKGIAPLITQNPNMLEKIHCIGFPTFLLVHLFVKFLKQCLQYCLQLHDAIRDENFLVGLQLANSTHHAHSQEESSNMQSATAGPGLLIHAHVD